MKCLILSCLKDLKLLVCDKASDMVCLPPPPPPPITDGNGEELGIIALKTIIINNYFNKAATYVTLHPRVPSMRNTLRNNIGKLLLVELQIVVVVHSSDSNNNVAHVCNTVVDFKSVS